MKKNKSNNKILSGHYYEVLAYKGEHGLVTKERENLKMLMDEIIEIENKAKERGYDNDEKWLIVDVFWNKVYTEDGVFVSADTHKSSLALYDNGNFSLL